MVRAPMLVKSIVGLSASSILLAQLPAAPAIDAGRITLDVALVAAVVALWRAMAAKDARLAEKDAQIVAITAKFSELAVSAIDTMKELRGSVTSLKADSKPRRKS